MNENSPTSGFREFLLTLWFISALPWSRRGVYTGLSILGPLALTLCTEFAKDLCTGQRRRLQVHSHCPRRGIWPWASLCACLCLCVCTCVRVHVCFKIDSCFGDGTFNGCVQQTSYFLETNVSGKRGELPRDPPPVGFTMNVLQTGEYLDPKNNHSCVVLRCPPVFILS